jgi:NitT/TauT family transport system substrate-binding protein
MRSIVTIAAVAAALATASPAMAQQQLTPINVSYQPALYWALPFHVATEKGFWAQAGLQPSFSTFPAGPPQVAAAQARSWDVGGTGSAPAVLGAARFGLMTIGITNDESKANALMVRGDRYEALRANPQSIRGQRVLITTNTTVDYAARACLRRWGVQNNEVQFVNLGQAQIISAVTSNNGDIAGVWAPNTYTLEERANARYLCSGHDAGAIVPGAIVVRPDYARENPQNVARFLAVYLRGWSWIKANPAEARAMMKAFYAQGGVEVSDRAIQQEFALRPTFNLDEQLRIFNRATGAASEADGWFTNIGEFLRGVGTVPQAPAVADFVSDRFLRMVAEDANLRRLATEFDRR